MVQVYKYKSNFLEKINFSSNQMTKIFAHCFLDDTQKKYLKIIFFNVHNANEKILSPKNQLHASGFKIISQGNIISNEYIKKNCNILKVISNVSVGYDNVDIEFATKYNVAILNTPNILDFAVADLAMGLLIASARKICSGNNYVKAGKWKKFLATFFRRRFKRTNTWNHRYGQYRKKSCYRARAFNLKILYHNRNKLNYKDETTFNASYSTLNIY